MRNYTRKPGSNWGKITARKDEIRELYKTMTIKEIAAKLGYSPYGVRRVIDKYHLGDTEEAKERIERHRNYIVTVLAHTPQAKEKLSQTLAKVHRMEQWRISSGLPQQTKRHYNPIPKRVRRAIYRLRAVYSYLYTDATPYTLYYDKETRRTSREQHFVDAFGLIFKEYSE